MLTRMLPNAPMAMRKELSSFANALAAYLFVLPAMVKRGRGNVKNAEATTTDDAQKGGIRSAE